MPSRVIRGEINSSHSLSRVSIEADLTFRALLVAVDDYGRCEADPLMLKAVLFPRRSSVSPEQTLAWVKELAAEGCLRIYKADGVEYIELCGWEKHRSNGRRAASSRFPDPPKHSSEIRGKIRKSARLTSLGLGLGLGSEGRVAGEAASPPSAPASLLVNLLSQEPGEPADKAAWIARMEAILTAEAESEHPHDAKARAAKLRSLTLRYWRQELRNPGGGSRASPGRPETVAEAMARMDREEAEEAKRVTRADTAKHQ